MLRTRPLLVSYVVLLAFTDFLLDESMHIISVSYRLYTMLICIIYICSQLLFAVGTKLELVLTQLACEVAERHESVEGDLLIKPTNEHFWFNRPQLTLFLIHFILFLNAFEISYFFWIWVSFVFDVFMVVSPCHTIHTIFL